MSHVCSSACSSPCKPALFTDVLAHFAPPLLQMFCLFVIQAHNPMPARFGHSFALFRAAAARFMRRKHSVQQSLASQTGSDVTERARSSTRTLPTSPSCAAELEAGKLPQLLPAGGASQDAGLPAAAAAAQGGAADPATVQSEAEGSAKDKPASKRRTAKRMVVDLPIRTHAYKVRKHARLRWLRRVSSCGTHYCHPASCGDSRQQMLGERCAELHCWGIGASLTSLQHVYPPPHECLSKPVCRPCCCGCRAKLSLLCSWCTN